MQPTTPSNLFPVHPAFTGRDSELDALVGQITEHRVSHLAGLPGIGKSELARAAAHRLREENKYPHGVFQMSFEGAGKPSTLTGDLALRFGFPEDAAWKGQFAGRTLLIVWDQMDGMLEQDPDTVRRILLEEFAEAETVRHLVVSRTPFTAVPGMNLEPLSGQAAFDAFTGHLPESVSQRPGADDADLSRALDMLGGNPLAIRLVSQWCRPPRWTPVLPEALNDVSPGRDSPLPEGLSRAVALAVHELDTAERQLLSILAAFPGGASPAATSATYGASEEKALAAVVRTGLCELQGDRRSVPAAIRLEIGSGCISQAADRSEQAAVYLHQALNESKGGWGAGNPGQAMQFMNREWENIRAAFVWTLSELQRGGIDMEEHAQLLIDYCTAMYHLFSTRSICREGRNWMTAGVEAGTYAEYPQETALVQDYLGLFLVRLGERARARTALETALAAFREMNEKSGITTTTYHLGLLELEDGNRDAARELFEDALPSLREQDNRAFAAQAATYLGDILLGSGAPAEAAERYEEALALYEEGTVAPDMYLASRFSVVSARLAADDTEKAVEQGIEAVQAAVASPPRLTTACIPRITRLANGLVGHGTPEMVREFANGLSDAVRKASAAPPDKRFPAQEVLATRQLLGGTANLIDHLAAALGAGDDTDAARAALPGLARELDRNTGGRMGLENWISQVLENA